MTAERQGEWLTWNRLAGKYHHVITGTHSNNPAMCGVFVFKEAHA